MVFFQPPLGDPQLNQTRTDVERFKSTQTRLRFNLKWSDDPLIKNVSRRFLRQFMLLTSAELIAAGRDPAKVIWRFSYPEAMKSQDMVELRENLRSAWADLFSKVEGGEPAADPHPVRDLTSEGAAAAKYS